MNIFGLERHLKSVCVACLSIIKRICMETKTNQNASNAEFDNPFEIDDEVASKINIETATLFFNQAEKELEELVKIETRMTDRCYTFIGILSALVPVLVSLSISNKEYSFLLIPLSFCFIGYIVSYALLVKAFSTYTTGGNCDDYVSKVWVEHYAGDDMYRSYLIRMYEELRWKIEEVYKINEKRSLQFNRITISLFSIIICTPLLTLFI